VEKYRDIIFILYRDIKPLYYYHYGCMKHKLVSLRLMVIKRSKDFLETFSQLYKNAGHFSSYRYCHVTHHNSDISLLSIVL